MAEEHHESNECENPVVREEVTEDRGLFDFVTWEKEKDKKPKQGEVMAVAFEEMVTVTTREEKPCKEEKEEQKERGGILEKLHRSFSSGSSSVSSSPSRSAGLYLRS